MSSHLKYCARVCHGQPCNIGSGVLKPCLLSFVLKLMRRLTRRMRRQQRDTKRLLQRWAIRLRQRRPRRHLQRRKRWLRLLSKFSVGDLVLLDGSVSKKARHQKAVVLKLCKMTLKVRLEGGDKSGTIKTVRPEQCTKLSPSGSSSMAKSPSSAKRPPKKPADEDDESSSLDGGVAAGSVGDQDQHLAESLFSPSEPAEE